MPVERVAVVTGGNRGLGLEIVRGLAAGGVHTVLACRSADAGAEAAGSLGPLGDRVTVCPLDVTDEASVAAFVVSVHRRFRRCDVLVNNAAVALDGAAEAAVVDLDVVRATLETNLLGAWRLVQALTPAMRARRYGRIVNVSSGVGSVAALGLGMPAYRVSKLALNGLTRIVADELRPDGILVNACCPGRVRTAMGGSGSGASAAEAADTPVWLATLPPDGPTGGLFRNRQPLDW